MAKKKLSAEEVNKNLAILSSYDLSTYSGAEKFIKNYGAKWDEGWSLFVDTSKAISGMSDVSEEQKNFVSNYSNYYENINNAKKNSRLAASSNPEDKANAVLNQFTMALGEQEQKAGALEAQNANIQKRNESLMIQQLVFGKKGSGGRRSTIKKQSNDGSQTIEKTLLGA